LALAWVAAPALSIAACATSTSATIYTPYTGIDIPTSSVLGGVGCGPGGVDHYIAVLTYAPADAGPEGSTEGTMADDAGDATAADGGAGDDATEGGPPQEDGSANADGEAPSGSAATPSSLSAVLSAVGQGASSLIVAASEFACFDPSGVFVNLDGGADFDVWIFAYPAGIPADLPCSQGTCALSVDDVMTKLVNDENTAGEMALFTMLCLGTPEVGQHPAAHDCRMLRSPAPAALTDAAPTQGTEAGD
jgi:hypothetical protein